MDGRVFPFWNFFVKVEIQSVLNVASISDYSKFFDFRYIRFHTGSEPLPETDPRFLLLAIGEMRPMLNISTSMLNAHSRKLRLEPDWERKLTPSRNVAAENSPNTKSGIVIGTLLFSAKFGTASSTKNGTKKNIPLMIKERPVRLRENQARPGMMWAKRNAIHGIAGRI